MAATAGEPDCKAPARKVALDFGRALTRGESAGLPPLLPARGRIRLQLNRLGPADGAYGSSQLEALLQGFFRQGSVRTFDLLRLECAAGDGYALAQARARLADRDGRPADVELHLALEPEDERWVLREIRESSP